MGSYLIYVPPRAEWPDDASGLLLSLGLLDLGTDRVPSITPVTTEGPDGKHGGRVLAWPRPDAPPSAAQLTYLANRQTWQPCKPDPERGLEAGRFWLGSNKSDPVRPQDVERSEMLEGLAVKLGDGNEWKIPTAAVLPRVYGIGDDGNFESRVEPRFRQFCERAELIYKKFVQPLGQIDITDREGVEFATLSLSLNYRLNRDLIDWLGLLTSETLLNAVGAPIELVSIRDVESQKKTGKGAFSLVG